jgi:hypothetical protein
MTPRERPPVMARAELLRLIHGFQASQAIHVAATLGLAGLLPASAAELARATGTHLDALYRLMRVLVAIGILEEGEDSRYSLSALGQFLRPEVPGTCAAIAEMIGRPNFWGAWGDLLHTVRTGETAFDHLHGCGVWEYRCGHPEDAGIFDRAMASGTEQFARSVLEVCDFGRFRHVVDVGGGDGMFLATILGKYPETRGTLFDRPEVIARASESVEGKALAGRICLAGGDFFRGVPVGGDAYLLKWILHDWSDVDAIEILKSCRRAMSSAAKLLVAEYVIGPGNGSPESELMDLMMMVMNGGRERTCGEFERIFVAAGFMLTSVTATPTSLRVFEAVPGTNSFRAKPSTAALVG